MRDFAENFTKVVIDMQRKRNKKAKNNRSASEIPRTDQTDHSYGGIIPTLLQLGSCSACFGCISNQLTARRGTVNGKGNKRWRVSLENAAYMVLSENRNKYKRLRQRTEGVKALEKLVKKIKQEGRNLRDEDISLLLRCCLNAYKYFEQRTSNGELLMRNSLQMAYYCYSQAISTMPRNKNRFMAVVVIRFLHDDDKWTSCDFGAKVLRDLMHIQGTIYSADVEAEILLTLIANMALYCPGPFMIIPNFETGTPYSGTSSAVKLPGTNDSVARRNPILEMARVLYGILSHYQFRDIGEDAWVALDALVMMYTRIAHVRTAGVDYEDNSIILFNIRKDSKEWDMTESAILGSIRNLVEDIVSSDLKFKAYKNPLRYATGSPQNKRISSGEIEYPKIQRLSDKAISSGLDNLCQMLIIILTHTINVEMSQVACYQLLDILTTATRVPLGYRTLKACLPGILISLLLEAAKQGDPGVSFRSHKLLQHILDRHSIRIQFVNARIFRGYVRFASFECKIEDWEYFRHFRKNVYDTLYRNFLTISNTQNNLESLFCTICMILVEMQFSNTARDIAELMVNIQDAILVSGDLPNIPPKVSGWIHSIVISVLSLIAAIHGLIDLETLVTEAVSRRSEVAPFLIPPLQTRSAIGDITDFQEDLFFNHGQVSRCLTDACFENRKQFFAKSPSLPIAQITNKENVAGQGSFSDFLV